MTTKKMKVEIWSDLTCSFCYVAKRKLEEALSRFKNNNNLDVIWKSFELAPGLQTDPGKNLPRFVAELRGISIEQAQSMARQVADSAREAGLVFDLDRAIPANSLRAHCLSHLARAHGLQSEAEEALFKAYFTDGRNIDDLPTLLQLAYEIGLNATEAKRALESEEYAGDVRRDIEEARQAGINSVPFFVFNGNTKLSGMQDSKVFLEILEKTHSEWQAEHLPPQSGAGEGESCRIGEDCSS
jgi:predicted DsbA family dithiol-disulfide isomerase